LVVKVDGKRPISVIVMAGATMMAEVEINELNRIHDQVTRMLDHWDKFVGKEREED
jgi:hypothetical protein